MSLANDLTTEQREQIATWVGNGADLAEVQRRLQEEFELRVNYMETRFLVSDLGLELKSDAADGKTAAAVGGDPSPADVEAALTGGGVRVTVDDVTPPHALIAGKVTFSDGEKGMWYIDQMGQPGLDMDTPGYRPEENDLREFQQELQKVIEKAQGRMG